MKKVLLSTTALVLSAGIAAADVTLNGNGRMGVIGGGNDDLATLDADESDLTFTSRIRFNFAASGETDGGLSFGGSLASDDTGDTGTAGTIFIEGAFGKLTMGDIDGAAESAIGDVSGVGLTGLGDLNETWYIASAGEDLPGALYEYSAGDLTFYASADRPNVNNSNESLAVGVSYGFGNYSVALGYEDSDDNGTIGANGDQVLVGATAAFGDATVKAVYGSASGDAQDRDQWALSLDYIFGAATVTAFYRNVDDSVDGEVDAYGLGAAYDLGGGASLKGGIVDSDALDDMRYDFGVSMSF